MCDRELSLLKVVIFSDLMKTKMAELLEIVQILQALTLSTVTVIDLSCHKLHSDSCQSLIALPYTEKELDLCIVPRTRYFCVFSSIQQNTKTNYGGSDIQKQYFGYQ